MTMSPQLQEMLSCDHLAQLTNLYETLFKQLADGVFFQNREGVIELVNPAAERMLNLNATQLRQLTGVDSPWTVVDADGVPVPTDAQPGNLALASGQPQRDVVLGIVLADGDTRWIKASAELVTDSSNGSVRGALTSFTDITHERNTRQALQAQTERSRVAIESAEMGVWEWIPETATMLWDEKMFEIYGFSENNVLSAKTAWEQAVHPEDRERVNRELLDLLKAVRNSKTDFRIIWPDGAVRHVRSHGRVMKNEKGKLVRITGVTHDITREVIAEQKLRDLAYSDALTGAASRAGLNFELARAIVRANQRRSSFALITLGVDRFKEINENYGYAVGDKLLVEVARRIRELLTPRDTLARFGGDEFTLLLESVESLGEVRAFAGKLHNILTETLYLEAGFSVNIKASVGACLSPDHGDEPAALLKYAGLAMRHAKQRKDQDVVIYSAAMSEELTKKFALKCQLYSAVRSEEFQLYYQPIVDLANAKVIGCEALIRWWDDEGKPVSPMDFIPIIEESGLIVDLGKWINDTAVKQWKLWQQLVPDLQYVSVNVSPHQLADPRFADELLAMVNGHGVRPQNIQLEITEGTFLTESLNADSVLKYLAECGFRLAIDDFGTGYSSLAYLKRFNVDVIKVDRSFIIDIVSQQSDRDIVSAILAMNNKLGFKTLVEGLETESQAAIVRELGCDSAQGYLYGRPTFADEFAELYIRSK